MSGEPDAGDTARRVESQVQAILEAVMSAVHERLAGAGLAVPDVAAPVAAYVPAVVSGQQIFTAGQLPFVNGELSLTGKVGTDVSVEDAAQAAQQAALNAVAAMTTVVDDLDRIDRIVKVTVFVASEPTFTQHPIVANGASQLFALAFGDQGIHARSAVGVASLPLDSPVEVEVIAALK